MAVIPKKLANAQQLTNAVATYYTTPSTIVTIIDKMTLTNTSASAVSATVYLVDITGTAANSECLISALGIGAGATYTCPEIVGHILNHGDTIQALASANSALTVRISGREVSGL